MTSEYRNLVLGLARVWFLDASSAVLAQPCGIFSRLRQRGSQAYSVSFGTKCPFLDQIRSWRKVVMHKHYASCVIFLTDQTFNFTLPEERRSPLRSRLVRRMWGWNVHLPKISRPIR